MTFEQYNSEHEEAAGVVDGIDMLMKDGQAKYSDCAVLYRTNARSRVLEEKFVLRGFLTGLSAARISMREKEIRICFVI